MHYASDDEDTDLECAILGMLVQTIFSIIINGSIGNRKTKTKITASKTATYSMFKLLSSGPK